MSKAFIRSLSSVITRITHAQELMLKRKRPSEDDVTAIEEIDSAVGILHSLREEEKEIMRYDANFLEDFHQINDELDEEDA